MGTKLAKDVQQNNVYSQECSSASHAKKSRYSKTGHPAWWSAFSETAMENWHIFMHFLGLLLSEIYLSLQKDSLFLIVHFLSSLYRMMSDDKINPWLGRNLVYIWLRDLYFQAYCTALPDISLQCITNQTFVMKMLSKFILKWCNVHSRKKKIHQVLCNICAMIVT